MKIQFKEQGFQLKAVDAVVKCFEGQPLLTNRFTLEKSRELIRKSKQRASGKVQAEMYEAEMLETIGYRNARLQLSETDLLQNIVAAQRKQYLFENQHLDTLRGGRLGPNLTLEMETGTGKTYVYIRTMYELHRRYGWSKFIIIVPSVAIREGVLKSFDMMEAHFMERYGHKIRPFIYNSSRPEDIETFASDSRISVMIINMQAFAARANNLRIHQELDQFGSRKPIELLAQTRPILIIDEPQSVGTATSVAIEKMEDFNPLFTLRYSATHKEEYNKIFRLDALDAYRDKLVKKIQVKGINVKGSTGTEGYLYLEAIETRPGKAPVAIVEYEKRNATGVRRVREKLLEGSNLFELSGNLPAYRNHILTELNGGTNTLVLRGQTIAAGDILNDRNEEVFRRIQIRETILSHLQKEKELFDKGIKVLSLFFIDSVEKYRRVTETGEIEPGPYARIFEEEYRAAVANVPELFGEAHAQYLADQHAKGLSKVYGVGDYFDYLKRDDADRVHNGYFSIDKKGRPVDPTIKRGSDDSEDPSAYDLIMKDKERLLSFEEPVRFIFSHSALKEGWDNPNVFQICALKNPEGGSQARRRQEVGRGMRLCVDAHGIRQDYETIGSAVHETNRLTVIASESYEHFAKGLQAEIADSLKARPQKADDAYFSGKLLTNAEGDTHRLTEAEAGKLAKFLYKHDILDDDDRITPAGKELLAAGGVVPVPETLKPYANAVAALLQQVYTGEAPKPENDRDQQPLKPNANLARKEFQELWNRMSLKTKYRVDIDTQKLIAESIVQLNSKLHLTARSYEVKTGELRATTKEQLREGTGIYVTGTQKERLRDDLYAQTAYDLIGELESRTHLTRRTVAQILTGINEEVFLLLRRNPEEFIARSANLINEAKASLIINNITYHKTEDRFEAQTVFANTSGALRSDEVLKKHIYDALATDSKTEKQFAKAMEEAAEVVVYAKLPTRFYIQTPHGRYSPDWAIVLDGQKTKHVYFVAETKGSESDADRRETEKAKIHCARKHFEAISGPGLRYEVISTFDTLLDIATLRFDTDRPGKADLPAPQE